MASTAQMLDSSNAVEEKKQKPMAPVSWIAVNNTFDGLISQ